MTTEPSYGQLLIIPGSGAYRLEIISAALKGAYNINFQSI